MASGGRPAPGIAVDMRPKEEELKSVQDAIKQCNTLLHRHRNEQSRARNEKKNLQQQRKKVEDVHLSPLYHQRIKLVETMAFKTDEQHTRRITHLQQTLSTNNFKLSDENKIVAEIDRLRASQHLVPQLRDLERQLDDYKSQKNQLTETIDSLERTCRDAHKEIVGTRKKMDELRAKEQQLKKDCSQMRRGGGSSGSGGRGGGGLVSASPHHAPPSRRSTLPTRNRLSAKFPANLTSGRSPGAVVPPHPWLDPGVPLTTTSQPLAAVAQRADRHSFGGFQNPKRDVSSLCESILPILMKSLSVSDKGNSQWSDWSDESHDGATSRHTRPSNVKLNQDELHKLRVLGFRVPSSRPELVKLIDSVKGMIIGSKIASAACRAPAQNPLSSGHRGAAVLSYAQVAAGGSRVSDDMVDDTDDDLVSSEVGIPPCSIQRSISDPASDSGLSTLTTGPFTSRSLTPSELDCAEDEEEPDQRTPMNRSLNRNVGWPALLHSSNTDGLDLEETFRPAQRPPSVTIESELSGLTMAGEGIGAEEELECATPNAETPPTTLGRQESQESGTTMTLTPSPSASASATED